MAKKHEDKVILKLPCQFDRWALDNKKIKLWPMYISTATFLPTNDKIYPHLASANHQRSMLTSPVIGTGERLACVGGMTFGPLTFSVIIHKSFRIICDRGNIYIHVEVSQMSRRMYIQCLWKRFRCLDFFYILLRCSLILN
jgi:hypothetical protein